MNLLGKTVVSIAVLAVFAGAEAAQNGRAGMMSGKTSARMPTMPVVSLNTLGNPAVSTVNQVVQPSGGGYPTPTPVDPVDPVDPIDPDTPSECPDGGVANSSYTISMCMNDILQCVNTGALQGGINDLFNADVRNSIMSGMKLCQSVIDRCIREVRVDCRNIYAATTDVWLDFNSRVIQPEYYNFVLRKTGLTPNQAENTCLLLDRNTYGSSFAAVSDSNAVNNEYNRKVGAYNEARNGTLSKNNPQGVEVNSVGYDGNRGHYARWDASKGECLIRVAAYNKDKLITNSWLFGAIGDETPAEVWQKAGSTFTCNKELFDFKSLLNDTKTAAVLGVGGGTILGTAIGAGAGAAAYNKKHKAYEEAMENKNNPCSDEAYRKELGAKIYASKRGGVLKSYAYKSVVFNSEDKKFSGTPIFNAGDNFNDLTESQCRDLHELSEKVGLYESKVNECLANPKNQKIANAISTVVQPSSNAAVAKNITLNVGGNTMTIAENVTCGQPEGVTQNDVVVFDNECKFVPLREGSSGVLCEHNNECLNVSQVQYQINELKGLLSSLEPGLKTPKDANKGKEIGKGAAIGAATGAGVGGIVTGITALVEKNNISCKVGDGLNTVSLGKSHSIDSLKDFYVKWNLQLPDTVTPTAVVTDAASWQQACSQFNSRLMDCPYVQVNLKRAGSTGYELISAACKQSGSVCIADEAVMNSHLAAPTNP